MKKSKLRNLFSVLLLLLTSCAVSNTTVKPSVIPSKTPSSSLSTPIPTISPTIAVLSSALPTLPTNENLPEKSNPLFDTTISGTVYDINGNPVDGATVSAKTYKLDCKYYCSDYIPWNSKDQLTIKGKYLFRNVPAGARIEITVTKEGWTKGRKVEFSSDSFGKSFDASSKKFDFGGVSDLGNIYAIQENPQITSGEINGMQISGEGEVLTDSSKQIEISPDIIKPWMTGIESENIVMKFTFSKPVQKDSVENNFKIISTSKFNTRKIPFVIDKSTGLLNFDWANTEDSVKITINKPILCNFSGVEANYLVEFKTHFLDKKGLYSLTNRCFKFAVSHISDFFVFSVKNQDKNLSIMNLEAFNNDISNTSTININFNLPMNVLGYSFFQWLQKDYNNTNNFYSYNTSNYDDNNSTVIGYNNSSGEFKPIYIIALLKADDIKTAISNKSGKNLKLQPLKFDFGSNIIKNSTVYDNTISLELNKQVFEKGDILILSAGNNIDTGYNDIQNSIFVKSLTPNLNLPQRITFSNITDPSGSVLEQGKVDTTGLVTTSNSQKYVVVR